MSLTTKYLVIFFAIFLQSFDVTIITNCSFLIIITLMLLSELTGNKNFSQTD